VGRLGWTPELTVSGLAMSGDDRGLLTELATAIVEAHGGHVILEHAPDDGDAVVVESRDIAGYFGRFANDPDYVRANIDQIAPTRYWVVDVRGAVAKWVLR
jgi:hypothetical protein